MQKLLGIILLLLAHSGCYYEEEIEFYRGEKLAISKIRTLCEIYELPVRSVNISDKVTVLRGSRDLRIIYGKMLSAVEPYLSNKDIGHSSVNWRDFFIPKKSSTKVVEQNNIPLSEIFEKIENENFILAIKGQFGEAVDKAVDIDIYYVSHPVIEELVDELIKDISKVSEGLRIKKNVVSLDLGISTKDECLRTSLSVFEPFSFKVLNSERNLAGMQFLLLLLLFLLSGFILGLWWKGRA